MPCSLQYPDCQDASSLPSSSRTDRPDRSARSHPSTSPPSSDSRPSHSPTSSETQRHHLGDPVPHFPKFLDDTQHGKPQEWAPDLELLHHYTAIAFKTFSSWGEVGQTLQYDVPREGLIHPFLLQQVLAFSGFHLAYLNPDRRNFYLVRASVHQDQAVTGINSALANGVTPLNCHALYASSLFLLICAFATYPSCEVHHSTFSPLQGLVGVFCLVDGVSLILNSSDQDLREGPLQGLFAGKSGSISPSDHIQALVDHLFSLEPQILEPRLDQNGHDTSVVLEAAASLAHCLLSVHEKNSFAASVEVRAAVLWPLRMSNRFLGLIQQRDPLAMAVLAHYCVLLQYAESTCWFVKGWAGAVMASIAGDLAGTPFQEMIHWPGSMVSSVSITA
ncbi:hypothetical protein ACJZ2D_013939 [Fusarium nematophilum]